MNYTESNTPISSRSVIENPLMNSDPVNSGPDKGDSVAEWLRCLTLKLLAPLRWGSNPMRGSCQLLTESCWFTPMNNVFLQLWKLTAIYNQTWLNNVVKDQFTSPHLTPKVGNCGSSVVEARTKELGVPGSSTIHYFGCDVSLGNTQFP